MNRFPHTSSRAVSGFTLLETILALGVTFLIVTAAFGVVNSCLELGEAVKTSRSTREDSAAVEDIFRSFFSSLPQTAVLECKLSGSQSAALAEIRIQNAPALAGSFLSPGPNEVLVIQTTEEPGGYLRLSVGVSEGQIGNPRPGPVSGFAIAGHISTCRWRFFQADRNEWQDKWAANMGRPRFVELTFAQTTKTPERWVFPVPVFVAGGNPQAPQNPDGNPPDPDPNAPRDPNRPDRPGRPNPGDGPNGTGSEGSQQR